MEGNVVSFGYARRRKHNNNVVNPYGYKWKEVHGRFEPICNERRIQLTGHCSNSIFWNIPLGARGTVVTLNKEGGNSLIRFDEYKGLAYRDYCIWIEKSCMVPE